MSEITNRIKKFVKYAQSLDGDKKGEAQVFCDRLFIGPEHDGYKEAGAQLEYRLKRRSTKGTSPSSTSYASSSEHSSNIWRLSGTRDSGSSMSSMD